MFPLNLITALKVPFLVNFLILKVALPLELVLAENVSEDEIIEHLTLVKRRFEMNGGINLSKGYSLIKDTPEKAFRYADEMLYADKLSKKRRNCSAENI